MPAFFITMFFLTGFAVNVESSGKPLKDPEGAANRVIESLKNPETLDYSKLND